jgi:steroid delta-isomerase-like uncharacterized protein
MTQLEHINLIKQSVEAFNQGDFNKAVEPFAENAIFTDITQLQPLHGREAIRKSFEKGRIASPDLKLTPTNWITSEDQVVMEYTTTGTHKGPWEVSGATTIPATNKRFQTKGVAVAKLSEGRIIGLTDYSDSVNSYKQLGVLQAAGIAR